MEKLFVWYPKCGTCRKAKKWLEENGVEVTERLIAQDKPTEEELRRWIEMSGQPVKKFFNTSGQVYRSMGLKDKLKGMSDDEKIALLATDGMLVKRPILVTGDKALVGFKEADWESLK